MRHGESRYRANPRLARHAEGWSPQCTNLPNARICPVSEYAGDNTEGRLPGVKRVQFARTRALPTEGLRRAEETAFSQNPDARSNTAGLPDY